MRKQEGSMHADSSHDDRRARATRQSFGAAWGATLAALGLLTLAAPASAWAQATAIEPEAMRLLKRMTDYVGGLPQFGLDTAQSIEVVLVSGQKIQFTSAARLVVQRPNKLFAERVGDVIRQSFFYDGKALTLFNPDDGYFATVPAPGTIDAMLDFARDSLDVIAPAGDLTTQDAYARLMADTTAGFVVGKSTFEGVRCDHLAFRGYGVDWQVWIEDGAQALPRKYIISTVDVVGAPQFEVLMRNWTVSPAISPKQFHFTPPAGATEVKFLPTGNAGAVR
jgi:hypothetical protein